MERKVWQVDVDGKQHEVALSWTYWGGDRQVHLDGELVHSSSQAMRGKSEQPFQIDGHTAVVRTRAKTKVSPFFVISLEVDGKDVASESALGKWEKGA